MRSFEQFSWFLANADIVDVYDNTGAEPRRVLTKRGDQIGLLEQPPSFLKQAIERAYPDEEWDD